MPKQKFSQKKFNISNPKVLIPILFVFGFGLFGLYKMISSSAATPSTTIVTNYDYRNILYPPSAPIDDTHTFSTRPIKVNEIRSGQNINYTTIATSQTANTAQIIRTRTCYTMRVTGQRSATVKIYGLNGISKNVNVRPIPANLSFYAPRWQQYCISAPYADGQDGHYGVDHISGDTVRVYDLNKEVTYAY